MTWNELDLEAIHLDPAQVAHQERQQHVVHLSAQAICCPSRGTEEGTVRFSIAWHSAVS